MSLKVYDGQGRWRNKTVAFRISPEEDEQLETAVRLSGLTKQDYIIRRLQDRDGVSFQLTRKPQEKGAMSTMRRYDAQTKMETVVLAKEIGIYKASQELGIPEGTIRAWVEKERAGELPGSPGGSKGALSLSEENKQLKQRVKELERTNKILREASAFFAARQKK